MYLYTWLTVTLLQVSVAELDFVQVFDILITAEGSNSSFHPEILFLNASGFVLARMGDPATLYCRIMLVDDSPDTKYKVHWETGRFADLVVAQFDQSQDSAPTIHPSYRDRLSMISRGPENQLHFSNVQEQDFGEYVCKGQIVGQEGESFSSLSVLAEDTRTDLELLVAESANETLVPQILSLNCSGPVRARLGAPAQLQCRIQASSVIPGTMYGVEWQAVGEGSVTLARLDQGQESASYLNPRYKERLMVSLVDVDTQLRFSHVEKQDYGEHSCKAWVSGHPEGSVTASITLKEDTVPDVRPSTLPTTRARKLHLPEILALNTSERVVARVGGPATLSCRVVALHAGPETRYRLGWASLRAPNLTVAQIDQGTETSSRVHPSYWDRVTMTSRGPASELRFRVVKEEDPGEYVCKAGISGRKGDDISSPVFLLKGKQKVLSASSETAILWLILHFFVVLFAMAIGIGSCFLTGTKNRILPEHV
ncbi:uncharacterized protein LOC119955393 [Scyliorhinus canicula]|uniref:uncharacterized protein LOC119955393 n=1 Tax=Scyliorhinus canicula TaxID=7830 RepID=UPI0018F5F118|nr:uncharacterized protein LOC119955393 [Scyliorhinus canicula]